MSAPVENGSGKNNPSNKIQGEKEFSQRSGRDYNIIRRGSQKKNPFPVS
jgi:hypothetical protein